MTRLKDRFGEIPPEGMELIRIVRLRRMARLLGIEKIILKQGQMNLYLVSSDESAYYQSRAFGQLLPVLLGLGNRFLDRYIVQRLADSYVPCGQPL